MLLKLELWGKPYITNSTMWQSFVKLQNTDTEISIMKKLLENKWSDLFLLGEACSVNYKCFKQYVFTFNWNLINSKIICL